MLAIPDDTAPAPVAPAAPKAPVPPIAAPSVPMRPNDATPSIPLSGGTLSSAPPPTPAPAAAPAPTAAPAPVPPASPIPLAGSPTAAPYANAATITPGGPSDYTNKTITPGAGVDRLKLANDVFESSAKASDPYYQKTLRDANSAAGANGQLGSGELRTSLGDAASNRALNLDTLRSGLMHDATSGSIEDQYKNIGIAQQQQGFQSGQQQTAFNQATTQAQLEEALRSGDFSRAAQMLALGNAGNPSDTALSLANSYGQQAGAAGNAVSSLVGNSVRNNNTTTPDWLQQLLANSGGGGASSPPDYTTGLPPIASTPSAPPTDPWNYSGTVKQPQYPGSLPLAGAT